MASHMVFNVHEPKDYIQVLPIVLVLEKWILDQLEWNIVLESYIHLGKVISKERRENH